MVGLQGSASGYGTIGDHHMGQLILVLGGARSGKSTYAQQLAQALARRVLFVATAEAGDAEMTAHCQTSPGTPYGLADSPTPRHVGAGVRIHLHDAHAVLVDCMTLLVSNVIVPLDVAADLSSATAAVEAKWRPCKVVPVPPPVSW